MQIIIGIPNCSRCKQLKETHPDVKAITLEPAELLDFARKVGISEVPFVVSTGGDIKL